MIWLSKKLERNHWEFVGLSIRVFNDFVREFKKTESENNDDEEKYYRQHVAECMLECLQDIKQMEKSAYKTVVYSNKEVIREAIEVYRQSKE